MDLEAFDGESLRETLKHIFHLEQATNIFIDLPNHHT